MLHGTRYLLGLAAGGLVLITATAQPATAAPPAARYQPYVRPAYAPTKALPVNQRSYWRYNGVRPGSDWWRIYPWSPYNAWRNPYWYPPYNKFYPYPPYQAYPYYSSYPVIPPIPPLPPVDGIGSPNR
jgi:hypothetical protein